MTDCECYPDHSRWQKAVRCGRCKAVMVSELAPRLEGIPLRELEIRALVIAAV